MNKDGVKNSYFLICTKKYGEKITWGTWRKLFRTIPNYLLKLKVGGSPLPEKAIYPYI